MHKSWDSRTVTMEIKQAFKEKIAMDSSIELLMACGSKLVAPKLHSGQELSGLIIHKILKSKAVYVRPSTDLPCKLDSTDSEDSVMELDEDTSASYDLRTTSASHGSLPTRRRNSRRQNASTRQVCVARRARANQPSPQVTSDQPPLQGTSDQPPPQLTSDQPPPQMTSDQPPPQVTIDLESDNSVSQSPLVSDNYDAYLSIMGAMPDLSSDEEVNEAILASLESSVSDWLSAQEVLRSLASKINCNQRCRFNINRSAVLDGAVRGFKRLSYNPTFQMCVKFSDDLGVDEEAVDLGGPRREFLRLLMEALAHSQMFEGREGNVNLALESLALREDKYFFAGQAIAVSLVHGGPAPGFFSSSLYASLTGKSPKPEMEEISDSDLYTKIKKVSECTSFDELQQATAPLTDYLANAGCLRPLKHIQDKYLLVEDIIMFQVVHRVSGAFERFREGMKTLGALDAIRMHPDAFRPLFCHEPSPLTADVLEQLFEIRLSAVGSNKRRAEECVVAFWRDYLLDVEEQEGPLKLEGILAFATGADTIPPLGFSPQPSVDFLHELPLRQGRQFPTANTCINCLRLPVLKSFEDFKESMDFALKNTQGFGQE
ncbi:G2/M phase-specific E3 ubiquitin-protein ligase-like [Alosa pseudoharengus]|uniref:G2/M phase-specific E3 ubiquitin-protein ligase-like n=1 Tax=Alosa pseudoharengus TaxID=34774 RepID=UPI003F8CB484